MQQKMVVDSRIANVLFPVQSLTKREEISYKRKHYIHKQRHGQFQIKACMKLEIVSQ